MNPTVFPSRALATIAGAVMLLALSSAISEAQGITRTGSNALIDNKTGTYDTADGYDALGLNTSGAYNTASGADALYGNTSGGGNTATGVNALYENNGNDNTADGQAALLYNTTGFFNTATGFSALRLNTTGSDNVANGYEALFNCTTDSQETATGFQALYHDTTIGEFAVPNGNVATGFQALFYNSTGYENVADGYQALFENTSGGSNVASGNQALYYNTTGYNNVAVGANALISNTTGANNIAVGTFAGDLITAGANNIDIGSQGVQGESNVIRIGDGTTQTDTWLTGVIHGNGSGLTGIVGQTVGGTGSENTAVGYYALGENPSGSYNSAFGYFALVNDTTGNYNAAFGQGALLQNTTGYSNAATGEDAMENNIGGILNVADGTAALIANTSGIGNTAVGFDALSQLTGGNYNLAIGFEAGINLVTGTDNIYLGNTGVAGDNYSMRLGYLQTSTFIAGNTVGINISSPTNKSLDFGGGYLIAEGLGGVRCYIGDDGGGNDVNIGSFKSGVTKISCYNLTDGVFMGLECSSITVEGGSDIAEPFRITKAKQPVVPGDVVVIDDANPGQLTLTDRPYDTRVVGVVSGANGIHPGIQMQQRGLLDGGKNVALTGRVYVHADTSNGAIKPGDMLTSSGTPGRAMKVTDHARAQGAILGKAMSALNAGSGVVLVVVTLQ